MFQLTCAKTAYKQNHASFYLVVQAANGQYHHLYQSVQEPTVVTLVSQQNNQGKHFLIPGYEYFVALFFAQMHKYFQSHVCL